MIIGRYSVDPVDVTGGSYHFDPETQCYHVTIERIGVDDLAQAVPKLADAEKLLKQIDKACTEGSDIRVADIPHKDEDE
jgi:hypothetical protein